MTQVLGRPELTDRDLRIIAAVLEQAEEENENWDESGVWDLTAGTFTRSDIRETMARIAGAQEDVKNW